MSAPESSNSKAPPSLLSDKAKGVDGNGSRILANLEGRVAPPAERGRRSRAPLLLVALLVIAAGGWGAWHMQQRQHEVSVAAAPAVAPANAPANAPGVAAAGSGASAAPVAVAKGEAPAAASSQAATIIADDSEGDSRSTAASAASVSAAASGGDDSRLSRALAAGTESGTASAPVAAANTPATKHGKHTSELASSGKHEEPSHGKKESTTAHAGNHHANVQTASVQTKKAHTSSSSPSTSREDSDADLLAALVARTKPADAKEPDGKSGSSGKGGKVNTSATSGNARLAERVKECGQRGFFEDQLCRWRVCDGHWGKDPACPAASAQARQP
ncbi:hypothetical protein [Paraburkholderia sp. BCC1886]|uniref:hypothetical protein n=1 Tax=Paraburkholderia sp. BCC1886 TaxID=2562670 RepID=UPI0011831A1A|nr:hypothetical protein [Paraburkholderia sp. BCC1886]